MCIRDSDNVEGSSIRTKVRVRWYGDLFGTQEKANVEFKIKRGNVGTKRVFRINSFSLKENGDTDDLMSCLEKAALPFDVWNEIKSLKPALINSYKRKYFQTPDKKFRITLDWDLAYFRPNKGMSKAPILVIARPYRDKVVELKYNNKHDGEANRISASFPFRVTKSSKYVMGVDAVGRF